METGGICIKEEVAASHAHDAYNTMGVLHMYAFFNLNLKFSRSSLINISTTL